MATAAAAEKVWYPDPPFDCNDPPPPYVQCSDNRCFSMKIWNWATDLWEKKEGADFTIVTADKEIPCHILFIAAYCPVIKAMLELDMAEAQQNRVNLDYFQTEVIEEIVRYCYQGNLVVKPEYAQEMVLALDYLQFDPPIRKEIREVCEREEGYVRADNCLAWRAVCEHLELTDLAKKTKETIVSEWFQVMQMDSFLELDCIEIGRLIKEMDKDRVHKDYLVDGILRWMNYSAPTEEETQEDEAMEEEETNKEETTQQEGATKTESDSKKQCSTNEKKEEEEVDEEEDDEDEDDTEEAIDNATTVRFYGMTRTENGTYKQFTYNEKMERVFVEEEDENRTVIIPRLGQSGPKEEQKEKETTTPLEGASKTEDDSKKQVSINEKNENVVEEEDDDDCRTTLRPGWGQRGPKEEQKDKETTAQPEGAEKKEKMEEEEDDCRTTLRPGWGRRGPKEEQKDKETTAQPEGAEKKGKMEEEEDDCRTTLRPGWGQRGPKEEQKDKETTAQPEGAEKKKMEEEDEEDDCRTTLRPGWGQRGPKEEQKDKETTAQPEGAEKIESGDTKQCTINEKKEKVEVEEDVDEEEDCRTTMRPGWGRRGPIEEKKEKVSVTQERSKKEGDVKQSGDVKKKEGEDEEEETEDEVTMEIEVGTKETASQMEEGESKVDRGDILKEETIKDEGVKTEEVALEIREDDEDKDGVAEGSDGVHMIAQGNELAPEDGTLLPIEMEKIASIEEVPQTEDIVKDKARQDEEKMDVELADETTNSTQTKEAEPVVEEDDFSWVSDEDLNLIIPLVVDQWIINSRESKAVMAGREYNTLSDMRGSYVYNQISIHSQLAENELSPEEKEKLRMKRAEQMKRDHPIIKPKYSTDRLVDTFQHLLVDHMQKSRDGKSTDQTEVCSDTQDRDESGQAEDKEMEVSVEALREEPTSYPADTAGSFSIPSSDTKQSSGKAEDKEMEVSAGASGQEERTSYTADTAGPFSVPSSEIKQFTVDLKDSPQPPSKDQPMEDAEDTTTEKKHVENIQAKDLPNSANMDSSPLPTSNEHLFGEELLERPPSPEQLPIDQDFIDDKYLAFIRSRRFKQALAPELLKLVYMKNCSAPYLKLVLDIQEGKTEGAESLPSHDHLTNLPEPVVQVLRKGLQEKLAQEPNMFANDFMRPTNLAIIGGRTRHADNEEDDYRECYISYDDKTFQRLVHIHDKCQPRSAGICSIPPGFMIAGGGWSKQCTSYHATSRGWVVYSPLVIKKERIGAQFVNNRVYTVGGHHVKKWFKKVEFFDFHDHRWHQGPESPYPYEDPFTTAINTTLYVLHQYRFLSCLDDVGFRWKDLEPLPLFAPEARIASDGSKVYVAGGKNRVCVAYDPATNTWEEKARPQMVHRHGALCYHNGKLLLIGGINSMAIEEYDIDRDVWEPSVLQLPHPISHAHAMHIVMPEPEAKDYYEEDGYPRRIERWETE